MTTRTRVFLVSAFCLLPIVYFAQQPTAPPAPGGQQTSTSPAPATGLILGQAVDGTTGKPLAGVTVTLGGFMASPAGDGAIVVVAPGAAGASRGTGQALTDGDGHFVFHDLPKGSFTLTASKFGYIRGAYGRRLPAASGGGQLLELADGERRGDVTIALWKYAALGGTVIDEAGEPIIGAGVRVLRRTIVAGKRRFSQTGNQPTTDDRGVYRIAELMPGDYIVVIANTTATVPTSAQAAYADALRTGGAASAASAASLLSDPSGAYVSPMPGLQVGNMTLQPSGGRGGAPSLTGPLPAGAKLFVYETVYYPAATAPAQATVITLGSGEERSNIDFQVKPVPTSRVSGVVSSPDGAVASLGLQLVAAGVGDLQRDSGFETATTVSDATGAFTFLGVSPGQYTVRALKTPPRPALPPSTMTTVIQTAGGGMISSGVGGLSAPPPIPNLPTLWAAVPVSVENSDVAGVIVALHTGARISGRVEFEGTAEKPTPDRLNQLSVTIDPADGRPSSSPNAFTMTRGVVSTTGQFTTYQQPAGRYVLRPSALPGWTFKSAMLNGKDVADTSIDLGSEDVIGVVLVYTDNPAELAGTVRDSKNAGDTSVSVLAFPADSSLWTDYGAAARRFRTARATKDGTYKLLALPAGDYDVVAVPEELSADWQDPQLLQKLATVATRVSIGDGEKKTQDLKTSEVKR